MARLTDEQVEMEIVKLRQSEYVKLAKKEQNIRYERRNLLSQLQGMERRGRELAAAGIDRENIREVLFQDGDFLDEE